MTDTLAFAWLAIYLAAQAVAILLLHRYPTPARPGTVLGLALALIFAAPLGLLAVIVTAAIYKLRPRHEIVAKESAIGDASHRTPTAI